MHIRKTVGAAVVGMALIATVAVPSAGATCTSPKSGKVGCTQVYKTPPPPPPQPQQGNPHPPAWVLTFVNQWGRR